MQYRKVVYPLTGVSNPLTQGVTLAKTCLLHSYTCVHLSCFPDFFDHHYVDVIWWRPNCVFLIEVENTTNPRMGILRMANIMETKELRAELITVIPDSKLNTLKRCYEEPAVRKLLRGQIVRYLTYSTLMSNIDYINELDDFISLCDKVA
ncbi:MAG: hypothetical protein MW690_000258 [Methanophagales archaeon]|nr:hypothetical protein [Methanophagales archaeon]